MALNEFTVSPTGAEKDQFIIAEADELGKLHPDGPWIASDVTIDLGAVQ